jgi:hypothetical protein
MDPFYFLDFKSNLKDVHDNPFSLHALDILKYFIRILQNNLFVKMI